MSKRAKYGIPVILIMVSLFSSITLLQQGVLGQQPNQSSSKNITSQTTPQGTSLGSNKTLTIPNVAPATPATPAQTQTIPSSQSPSSNSSGAATSSGTPNMIGITNLSILTVKDKIFPIKYNITGGKLLGFVPNKDKNTLVAVLSPGGSGEKMTLTIELPRNIIDSKGQGNTDFKLLAKIDGKDVDYKEVANNLNTRILAIDFNKDNRLIEIIGNQMVA
jgi:hypothetical protein